MVAADQPTLDTALLNHTDEPPAHLFAEVFHDTISIDASTVVVPRAVLDRIGLIDECGDRRTDLWDLWLRIAARYPIGCLPAPLAVHHTAETRRDIEKAYLGQERVIQRVSTMCAAACGRHSGDASACVRDRRFRLYSELGYWRLSSGRIVEARRAFREALRIRPGNADALACYLGCFLGRDTITSWRRGRRWLRTAGHRKTVSNQWVSYRA
jgi:hypothetical protein